jgi:homoserine O-acetyltransferase/O-succinyltransferase
VNAAVNAPEGSSVFGTDGRDDSRLFARLPDPFPMYRGGLLHRAVIAYETWGRLNEARDNAILLFTGLSPSAHAASAPNNPTEGWWEGMVGPGLAIDSNRYYVICVNSLGSCFGSTGPASINPATGSAYRLSFPELSIEDVARAGYETLRSLKIERANTVIGPSLGGMSVLAFAGQFPRATRRLISISGSAAASPFAIALRSIQREAILRDPDWRGGAYEHPPATGMRIARKLGMMTYRSAHEWRERFARLPATAIDPPEVGPFAPEFAIQSYLEVHARKFVSAFDPNCYLYLSRAMDRFDLAAHGGSHSAAIKRSEVEKALIIGVESDMLFAIDEQERLAQAFAQAGAATTYAPLDCIEGHDSFLIDIERFGNEMRRFLEQD